MTAYPGEELLPTRSRAAVRDAIARVLEAAGLGPLQVGVVFVDDEEIRELNQTWRGIDEATDVLSFPAWEGERMPGLEEELGDLVISVDTCARQAHLLGHPLAVEVAVLTAHGLLHLLGLDHERSAAEALRQAECELSWLDAAGFPVEVALIGRAGRLGEG